VSPKLIQHLLVLMFQNNPLGTHLSAGEVRDRVSRVVDSASGLDLRCTRGRITTIISHLTVDVNQISTQNMLSVYRSDNNQESLPREEW